MKHETAWWQLAARGLLLVAMWAGILWPGPGWAQEAAAPGLTWSGFATVGVAHASERHADFTGSFSQPDGVGATRRWGLQPDTRLGLQADLPLGSQWSATLQGLVEYGHHGRWQPALSMGFLKWQPSAAWSLRAGRIPWSAYLTSDYRKVGFSLPWVRPPQEMYMLSFDHADGADLTWRGQWGDSSLRLQAVAGRSSRNIINGHWRGGRLLGGNVVLERGNLTLRLSHLQYQAFTLDIPQVDAVLDQVAAFDPQGVAAVRFRDRAVGYTTLGLVWDDGVWLMQAELANGAMPRTYLPDGMEAYVTVGRRFGSLTPTLTLAGLRDHNRRHSANPVLQQVIQAGQTRGMHTVSLGLRWDARPGTALKLQLDRVRHGSGQTGMLNQFQPGFEPGRGFRVLSLAADFVF